MTTMKTSTSSGCRPAAECATLHRGHRHILDSRAYVVCKWRLTDQPVADAHVCEGGEDEGQGLIGEGHEGAEEHQRQGQQRRHDRTELTPATRSADVSAHGEKHLSRDG
jgi:hypothetical protein